MTSVLTVLSTAAWAQAGQPAPASRPASTDGWTGLYFGANVGHVSHAFTGTIDFGSVVAGGINFPAESADFGATNAGSATIGVQAGYAARLTGSLIGGLEVQLTHSSATVVSSAGTLPANVIFFIPTDTLTKASGLITSIRGRAGTAMTPNLFVYGTIGVAMTKVTATGEFPATTVGNTTFPEANGSQSQLMKGLTIGVGAEYAPWKRGSLERLTIGAEFRHASLGTQTFNLGNVEVVSNPATFDPAIATLSAHANEFDIRVNYRFGKAPR